jgi:hypothetical protein
MKGKGTVGKGREERCSPGYVKEESRMEEGIKGGSKEGRKEE